MPFPIVTDELAQLERVSGLLEERPYTQPPKEGELVAELVRLREEIPSAKEEDKGALMEQYNQYYALIQQLRSARQAPQVDPDCPYFAHLRLLEDGKSRDLFLGKATRIDNGLRIVDWRNAPISKIFYRYQQGDDFEEEMGGKLRSGEVTARRTVTIRSGRLDRIDAPEGIFLREADGWIRSERAIPKLMGGERSAFRAYQAGEFQNRRLGTDKHGARTRVDKHLPDIAGLLDPSQFALITRPSSGFVVIRGSAGSGKTTVALHRIAWLAYDNPQINSPDTLFLVFSAALRDYVGHVLPSLGIERIQIKTFGEWASEQRRRHFPMLPKGIREDTPAVVLKLKQHPVMSRALEAQVRDVKAPATVDQVLDDWGSVLSQPERLTAFLSEVDPNGFSPQDIDRITTWCRDRHQELVQWLENSDKKEQHPELDIEDDALLLRAWQLRIGPLRHRGGSALRFRHVAIDEVQDFTPTEVQLLLGCLDEHRSITLAGDTQQHVMHDAGFTSWTEFFGHLGVQGTAVETLKVSYRCSAEVLAFGRAVLGDLREDDSAPTSTRNGPPVEVFPFTDNGHCIAFLASALEQLVRDEPYASVVVLTPNAEVSRLYFDGLHRADVPSLRLVENQVFTFAPGIEVTEIEQVKGLEFDYVILVDISAFRFPDTPGARRLLHVGTTRAVHQLWITHVGTSSAIIRNAMEELGFPE